MSNLIEVMSALGAEVSSLVAKDVGPIDRHNGRWFESCIPGWGQEGAIAKALYFKREFT